MTTHHIALRPPRRDAALALGVGLFLFAVYLFSYRGGFHSVDEVSMFAVTESLVKFGRLNTDQIAWTQWTTSQREAQGFFGVDGHVYSKKGVAMSLAMAPLYWLGLVIPGLGMLQTASLLNPIVTAVTAGLLFRLVRRLAYGEQVAMGVTLLYGLATITWVYSKYLFSEPLAGLLLLATTYLLVVFRQEGGLWRVGLAGLLSGLSVATRANNLFLIPVFGAYLIAIGVTGRAVTKAGQADSKRTWLLSLLPPAISFLLGLVPAALLLMGYNWMRAGNPLQTGYDLTIFSPNLLLGLYKLLFSPLRGLFVYSPLLVLSLPGLVWMWQRHRLEAAMTIGVTGITVIIFSAWTSGEGLSWGSRFLVPIVPFLCLPLTPVLDRALAGSKVLTGLLVGFGALSFVFQFLGVAINPWVYLAQLQANFGGEFFLEKTSALAEFRYTQIIGQLQSWSLLNSDVAWWQTWGFDAVAFGLSLFLVLAAVANLRWQSRDSRYQIPSLVTLSTITCLITYLLLARYFTTDQQFGPRDDSYTQALNAAVSQGNYDDQIVTVAQYHYHVPMNRFKARVPLVGFAQAQPPLPDTALPLLRSTVTGPNVWLITAGFAPAAPDNAVERWFTFNTFKASDEWFNDVRLVRYGVYRSMVTRSITTSLSKELRLIQVNVPESVQPGQTLPVEFTWLPISQIDTDYNLFLQLLTAEGTLAAQHDNPPNGGYTPTSTWLPGEEVTDRHGLALSVDLPSGDYWLIAGMYNPVTNERLQSDDGSDFVALGRITLQPSDP